MRVDELVAPRNVVELYDLDDEALQLKPYMTGDVFADVAAAEEETFAVMIVGHPCVIRGAGGQLMTRIPCCVLKPIEKDIAYSQWPDGDFDKFPLTSAIGLGDRQTVRLLEWRSVHKRELRRVRRRATMTERGVYIAQQRFTHAIARCAVPLAYFERASKHAMREAELEYEWVAELVTPGAAAEPETAKLVKEFHKLLDRDGNRHLLLEEGGDSRLRSIVRSEIKRRLTLS